MSLEIWISGIIGLIVTEWIFISTINRDLELWDIVINKVICLIGGSSIGLLSYIVIYTISKLMGENPSLGIPALIGLVVLVLFFIINILIAKKIQGSQK